MRGAYSLGVDLGTSHTVTVLRGRDGRVKPLLTDGQPLFPSAVFRDEAGVLHVGHDAVRLAQIDPACFEPNPKRRIAEGTVLLGGHEVRAEQLLTAVLSSVATKAWEVGAKDPRVVLTVPSRWAASRRQILLQAALWSGLGEVAMVPEPVAAAFYYVDILGQRIPPGATIAVFDFGGGTLDVAVVRREPHGGFTVLADGGLDDLGGVDVDAALVEHIGLQLRERHPLLWTRLTRPRTPWDRRIRRQFWDDVRGAKEMLSRSSTAPVVIPDSDEAVHLTREELETVATPMLRRAVDETTRVVNAARGRTGLNGMFLVGGSSRIPLVGRMLHTALGVAPTTLEQPELPVAEGSLMAVGNGF
ncbi:MAG TPA: Hsp70 family protein [Stackebrandtia sp.]|uniref:Hsp70 family protein n=1 Tax=Stackebrandtia sp. TaxID=2023065 RepID=UPI002D6DFAAF|nr:Hsp70 family protein [Stackebrandtia sp.]HZE39490.1 Hsp70 family protein [Stackebrandtia sp.]